jgi:hypothetical protein
MNLSNKTLRKITKENKGGLEWHLTKQIIRDKFKKDRMKYIAGRAK